MRMIKEHQERKNEILDVAEKLFFKQSYSQTSINDILQTIGIAKGTFYYYFKSKEEVLDAIIERRIEEGVQKAKSLVNAPELSVYEKLLKAIMAQKVEGLEEGLLEDLHHTENALMHQKSLVQGVAKLTPVLTEIVQQGIKQGVFHTPYPREVVEFLLISSSFMFDEGLFDWNEEEMVQKMVAFIHICENALGAEEGSFKELMQVFR